MMILTMMMMMIMIMMVELRGDGDERGGHRGGHGNSSCCGNDGNDNEYGCDVGISGNNDST